MTAALLPIAAASAALAALAHRADSRRRWEGLLAAVRALDWRPLT